MGQCACGPKGSANKQDVNRLLSDDNPKSGSRGGKKRTETKLLLLGTGNSGKSTVFKQFQLVHSNGFMDEERQHYKTLMVESTIATIRKLLQNANDMLFDGEMKEGEFDEKDVSVMLRKQKSNSSSTEENGDDGDAEKVPFAQFIGANKKRGGGNRRDPNPSDLSEASVGRKTDLSELVSPRNNGSNGKSNNENGNGTITNKKLLLEEERREHKYGGATVISDDVAHIAEVVKSLPQGTKLYDTFTATIDDQEVEVSVADMLKMIWDDPVIQRVYAMEGKIPTLEAPIAYYMEHIDRIGDKAFVPTEEDILHSRKQTRTVQRLKFRVEGKNFLLIDVGGQRTERRNWVNYFENVDAVLYIVGLDGYNQLCIEDSKTNRMRESLQLFKSICESPYFTQTSILLFLNKADIFKEKIKTVPLNHCFRSYTGPQNDYDKTLQYIHKRFEDTHTRYIQRNLAVDALAPKVYPHITTAVATEQMRFIIIACQSIFLRQGMAQCGIATM